MSTVERSVGRAPIYARLLRLRRLKITGLMSFLLLECTVAVAIPNATLRMLVPL